MEKQSKLEFAHRELDADRVKISDLENEIGQRREKISRKEVHNKVPRSDAELSREALQSSLATREVTISPIAERVTDISHLKESI